MNPTDKKKSLGSPSEWMNHAESDMKIARLASDDPDIRPEQACFHAQQAAEKAFKAVLLSQGIQFPLTHDIEVLIGIAEKHGLGLPSEICLAGILTPYAVETRYPGFWFAVSSDEVDEALRMARQTLAWAKELLSAKQRQP